MYFLCMHNTLAHAQHSCACTGGARAQGQDPTKKRPPGPARGAVGRLVGLVGLVGLEHAVETILQFESILEHVVETMSHLRAFWNMLSKPFRI